MTLTASQPPIVTSSQHPDQTGRIRPRRADALRAVLAVVAGACLALAFPPTSLWPLAFIGSGLLPLVVRGVRARRAFGLAFLAGLAFFIPTLSWVDFPGIPVLLALATAEAVFIGGAGVAFMLVQRMRWGILWCPFVWVADEAVRGRYPFGGFPWSRLAFSQVDEPALHWASVGGAPLVSFVTAAAGCAGVAAVTTLAARSLRRSITAVGVLIAGLGVALPALGWLVPVPTAGQPDAAGRLGLGFDAQRRAVLDNHVRATLQLAAEVRAGTLPAPDIVIWPENSSDIDPFVSPDGYAELDEAAAAIDRPILVGAVLDDGPGKVANTGLVWTANGPTGARYVKHHPVPFGEYVPFRSFAASLVPLLQREIPNDFVHGTGSAALPIGPTTIGDVICFEVAYDGLVRNAANECGRLLAVQTNNADFGFSAESAQQLQMVRLRAVEHGRSAVMASTTGISAIVTPAGRVLAQSPIFKRAILEQTLPLRSSKTLADRVGYWPEMLITAVAATAIVGGILSGRRRRVDIPS